MRRIGDCRFSGIERRSRWFRIFRRQSARWMECVKDSWPSDADGEPTWIDRRTLRSQAKALYRERYGNPMIWMFLLEIVIKAIIWWLQNREDT